MKTICKTLALFFIMGFCIRAYPQTSEIHKIEKLTLASLTHETKIDFEKKLENDTSKTFGNYTPGQGFTVADTKMGSMNLKVYSYVRYLNQQLLQSRYINSFNDTSTIRRRNDVQLNKVTISLLGWLLDPRFRYLFYVWTNNTAQGQTSQVVVAGNLTYKFGEGLRLGAGIGSLPGVRSTEGNFPFWFNNDNRPIADEFFRPSYTSGIWIDGKLTTGLFYQSMIGNNLSQLGIDAGQLDNNFSTLSMALDWFPTTGEFGKNSSYGDFEEHKKAATRLAGHFTISNEDRQSQPNNDAFDNVQIRLSDGSIIFKPDLFGPGISIDRVQYKMMNFDTGVKYKGFSFDAGYYYRWLDQFGGSNLDSLGFSEIKDEGFLLMTSYMIIPKMLQAFVTYNKIFGNYGNPWGARGGLNIYPWKNQVSWFCLQYFYLDKSPVGALSLPYLVGSTGSIFDLDFIVNF